MYLFKSQFLGMPGLDEAVIVNEWKRLNCASVQRLLKKKYTNEPHLSGNASDWLLYLRYELMPPYCLHLHNYIN
jgi:hypothetical protein